MATDVTRVWQMNILRVPPEIPIHYTLILTTVCFDSPIMIRILSNDYAILFRTCQFQIIPCRPHPPFFSPLASPAPPPLPPSAHACRQPWRAPSSSEVGYWTQRTRTASRSSSSLTRRSRAMALLPLLPCSKNTPPQQPAHGYVPQTDEHVPTLTARPPPFTL